MLYIREHEQLQRDIESDKAKNAEFKSTLSKWSAPDVLTYM
jgi:hypothetical protein